MIREQLTEALKEGMRSKDQTLLSTVRLILAALKDRDIAARGKGQPQGLSDEEVLAMLAGMVKQRTESITLYEQGGRLELAEAERQEIEVIRRFMPRQLSAEEAGDAVRAVIAECGASGLKDMGRVMAALKERFAGQVDMAKASALAKRELGGPA
ncbi:GatB/YqeY domain-containing protein [Roseospirillum parvum]|uniref:Glutamyl-tRNA amidotransferase n=1 Tax=Roseospirillum parvum TaxID=83401 RepID=A0A1G7TZJ0_9PROT|nr:GatB/YqeY domain-containing protein [Roseospirillum parvum]SDG40696.1 hypothetical protein SAMN05421742_101156 [Roseospirillum parvum]